MLHEFSAAHERARTAAGSGDADAAFRLGQMFALGLGCAQDDALAVRWYRAAAQRGHPQAQCNLGFMFGTGRGVPQDFVQAHAWYNLAAAAGEDTARRNRDAVAALMSPLQVAQAQERSRELFAELAQA